jgi:DNA-binding response OmpR family regulator
MNPKKLLIVDDNPDVRAAIEEAIGGDCTVFTAGRGDEALLQFLKYGADAIILDVELEGCLQGTDLLKLIKKGYPEIPIVMMSARYDLKNELLQAGADRFFDKPFDLFEVRGFFSKLGFL